MNNQHIVIDDSWYRRMPAVKERIAAGGLVLRQEDQRVYLALAREPARQMSPHWSCQRARLNQTKRSKRQHDEKFAKKWVSPTCS